MTPQLYCRYSGNVVNGSRFEAKEQLDSIRRKHRDYRGNVLLLHRLPRMARRSRAAAEGPEGAVAVTGAEAALIWVCGIATGWFLGNGMARANKRRRSE